MRPVLFEVFGRPVHSYGVLLVLGFLVAAWLAARRAPRYGLDKERVADLGFLLLVSGVVGARIAWVIQEWPTYAKNPLSMLYVWEGGLTFFGGLALAVLLAVWYAKRHKMDFYAIADALAPPLTLGYAIARIGCFLSGCCYGAECALPWAVRFPNALGARHPSQLYATLMNLVIFGLLLRLDAKRRFPGQVFMAFLALHGLYRYLDEFTRAGATSTYLVGQWLTDAQAAAIIILICGVVGYIVLGRKHHPAETPLTDAS